jgi:hypothetical protein
MIFKLWRGVAAAALTLAALPAQAQDTGDWSWQVTPYVWASGIGGEITPFTGAPTVEIDSSFSEVLEDLDAAFFISGFARRDRLVFLGDLSYSKSSKAGLVPPGAPATGELSQTSLTFAAGYRVQDTDGMTVDLLGGVRAWRIRGSVEVPLAGISQSPSLDFVDPIVALRISGPVAERWSATLYADIGGSGVGSERTSQLVATLNYQMRDNFYLSGGYRALSIDYDDDGTVIDMRMSGPLFGATWRF